MLKLLKNLANAHYQTKILVLMTAIYMVAIFWTTIQSYARLEYSRTGQVKERTD